MRLPRLDQTAVWLLAVMAAALAAALFYYIGVFSEQQSAVEIARVDLEQSKTRLFPKNEKLNPSIEAEKPRDSANTKGSEQGVSKNPKPSAIPIKSPGNTGVEHDAFLLSDASLWSYQGSTGPASWPSLSEAFQNCGKQIGQSPIDLRPATPSKEIPKLEYFFNNSSLQLAHQGQLVMFFTQEKSDAFLGIMIDGDRYSFEFGLIHTPSEHLIAGVSYDAEVQLVFKNSRKQTATLAILYEETLEKSLLFSKILKNLPQKNAVDLPASNLDLTDFLPQSDHQPDLKYYAYFDGSLTVPPCTPNVAWFVFRDPLKIGAAQIDLFAKKVGFNRRPVKKRGARRVLLSP